jgi:hypothetical protein
MSKIEEQEETAKNGGRQSKYIERITMKAPA